MTTEDEPIAVTTMAIPLFIYCKIHHAGMMMSKAWWLMESWTVKASV
jgi:hypothetical protein